MRPIKFQATALINTFSALIEDRLVSCVFVFVLDIYMIFLSTLQLCTDTKANSCAVILYGVLGPELQEDQLALYHLPDYRISFMSIGF